MTISAQGVRAVYDGSGSAGPFALTDGDAQAILFADDDEIIVTRYSTLGVPTVLTLNTHYTLTGEGSPTAGSVTLITPLAVDEQLVILRATDRDQTLDLISGGFLSKELMEAFFDKVIRIDQELAEGLARAIKLPITSIAEPFDFPVPEASAYIGWDLDGEVLENKDRPSSFTSGAGVPDDLDGLAGDYYLDTVTGDLYLKAGGWVVTASLKGPAGDEGDQGPAGSMVRSGSGAPSGGLGNDGDFYLNTANYDFYGPKAGGAWGSPTSLIGPSGAGTGDVIGPASATSGHLASFGSGTGKLIADSGILAADVLTTATGQPLDSDLTAIAALTTTATGRSLLAAATAAAIATIAGVGTGDSPQFTAVNIGAASDTTLARAAAGVLSVEGNQLLMAGKHTIPIMAGAMTSRATNGAASGTFGVGIPTLDFDTTTQEYAIFCIPMPKSWDEGTVTFIPYWTNAAGLTTETVVWSLSGAALSNDDAGAAPSQGTVQTSTDTWLAQNDIHIGPESAAITIGGSPAENDLVVFEISRVVGSDNLTGDAKLIGIKLLVTLNAATDA